MGIEITSQKALREARNPGFCYLCGKSLASDATNRDHVPPTSIFAKDDRSPPLILIVHEACNWQQSLDDQLIGQLVALLHGKTPPEEHLRLSVSRGAVEGGVDTVMLSNDLRPLLTRWIKGFHAALYRESLQVAEFATHLPFPGGVVDDGKVDLSISPLVSELTLQLKKNRVARSIDRIQCRNQKMIYECVWLQADAGQWFCAYALDLYGWSRLGDSENFGTRECVGLYRRSEGGVPRGASTGTSLEFSVDLDTPLF